MRMATHPRKGIVGKAQTGDVNPYSSFDRWYLRALSRGNSTFGLVLGFAICLSSNARFSSPGFRTMLTVPGAPMIWGLVLIAVAGLALGGSLLGRLRLVYYGLLGMCSWCAFLSLTFCIAFLQDSRAAVTGCVAYAWLSFLSAILAAGAGHRK